MVLVGLSVPSPTLAGATPNLIVNGDAETGDLTGWSDPLGRGYGLSATAHSGSFCFWGGVSGPTGRYNNELVQDVPLDAYATLIDAGVVTAKFSGWGRANSEGGASDGGGLTVEYRTATGLLQSFGIGLFSPYNVWVQLQDQRILPVGTRVARIRLFASRSVGISSDGGQDDMSLVLESATLAVPATLPGHTRLRLASANPARGDASSQVSFGAAGSERVRVEVLDLAGRVRKVLWNGEVGGGVQSLRWDGRDESGARSPAGLYFVRLESRSRLESVRLVRVN